MEVTLSVIDTLDDGSVYIWWGRNVCPDATELIYKGTLISYHRCYI